MNLFIAYGQGTAAVQQYTWYLVPGTYVRIYGACCVGLYRSKPERKKKVYLVFPACSSAWYLCSTKYCTWCLVIALFINTRTLLLHTVVLVLAPVCPSVRTLLLAAVHALILALCSNLCYRPYSVRCTPYFILTRIHTWYFIRTLLQTAPNSCQLRPVRMIWYQTNPNTSIYVQ